VRIMLE